MNGLKKNHANGFDFIITGEVIGQRPMSQRKLAMPIVAAESGADDILLRVRKNLPTISLATVYNCLETLVECELVRQVNLDRASTRFCPNLTPHAHFKCSQTGKIFDLTMDDESMHSLHSILPKGFQSRNFELSFTGTVTHSIN